MDVKSQSPTVTATYPAAGVQRDALARLRSSTEPVQIDAPRPAQPRTPPPAPTPTLSRKQILDATEAVLDEAGYDGATIRRIARQLDCAVGSIYRYFRDKRELLSAVTQRRFQPVLEKVEAGESWQTTASAYVRTALEQPQQYRLMFWLAGCDQRGPADAPEIVGQLLVGWADQLGDRREAERRWAPLHAGIMLGHTAADILHPAAHENGSPTPARAPARPLAPIAIQRDDLTLL
ncbi:TetR/AcrR family transcriptional regulator [Phycisphaerales bacterium AB-hyl4]|uniref:TetR/AcrR family transcriptional regulator n=1 Tax=Natronomicrosphaera hydrolytica TaxID=3242702 RepID=A0ABV4TZR1_9BACT